MNSEWITDVHDGHRQGTSQSQEEADMNAPSSRDLLATLINLLADQENVKITYEFYDCEASKRFGKELQYGS